MIKKGITYLKKQKQFQNLTIYGVGQFFNLVTPLLVAPYVIFVCGIEGYGKASLAMALMFFLIVFVDYGSDIIGVKDVSVSRENKNALKTIFYTTYLSKLVMLTLILIITLPLIFFIPYFSAEKELFIYSFLILIGQFINPTWFLQGIENFKQITWINIVSKIIYVIGIFGFVTSKDDYVKINLWWGIGMIFANSISIYYIIKKYDFKFLIIDAKAIKDHLKRGFSIFSSQIFVSIQMYSPILLIGFFGNSFLAGQYRVVDQVISVFKTYILLFFNFVFSRVCYLLGKNRKEGFQYWINFNGGNFIFIAFSMFFIFIFSNEIIAYFNPIEINELSKILKIAVFIPVFMAISVPLKQLLLGFNKEKQYTRITSIVAILNVMVMIFIIPFLEINGVLYTLLFAEIILTTLYFFSIKNNLFPRSN